MALQRKSVDRVFGDTSFHIKDFLQLLNQISNTVAINTPFKSIVLFYLAPHKQNSCLLTHSVVSAEFNIRSTSVSKDFSASRVYNLQSKFQDDG